MAAEGGAEDGRGRGRDEVVEADDKVANKERCGPRTAPPFQAEKTRCAAHHVIVSTTSHVSHVFTLNMSALGSLSSPALRRLPCARTHTTMVGAPSCQRRDTTTLRGGMLCKHTARATTPANQITISECRHDLNRSTAAPRCVTISRRQHYSAKAT